MRLILYILATLTLIGCKDSVKESKLEIDHINVWVKNPRIAKDKLEKIGFQGIPDSLCQIGPKNI